MLVTIAAMLVAGRPLPAQDLSGPRPVTTASETVDFQDAATSTTTLVQQDPALLEADLTALRSADKDTILSTLRSLSATPGYPDSADAILPALLWLKDNSDQDIAMEADTQVQAMGWPNHVCVKCIRRFGSEQDDTYKLMGIQAFGKLAWHNPQAMLALLEMTQNAQGQVLAMAHATAVALSHQACPDSYEMERWNKRATPLIERMESVFASDRHTLRAFALVFTHCSEVDPSLLDAAQEYLAREPKSSSQSQAPESFR